MIKFNFPLNDVLSFLLPPIKYPPSPASLVGSYAVSRFSIILSVIFWIKSGVIVTPLLFKLFFIEPSSIPLLFIAKKASATPPFIQLSLVEFSGTNSFNVCAIPSVLLNLVLVSSSFD